MTTAADVLIIDEILSPDRLATQISDFWIDWDSRRQPKLESWDEIQRYVFATDTTFTGNNKLPWSNKTTLPKLCQIRDNLSANYIASLFPKRKWLTWEGNTGMDESPEKRMAIENYMSWVIDRNEFYDEITKAISDYIDYGNCFVMPEWVDQRVELEDRSQAGYVGPSLRRISPIDIVFNPAASSFANSPKIIRSMISIGEVKAMMEKESLTVEEREFYNKLWDYMREVRSQVSLYPFSTQTKDAIYNVAGFDSFQSYLSSHYCEILTFYGDIYEDDTNNGGGEFWKNRVIKVIDRHKVFSNEPNPSFFGTAPIYHVGWRIRPDNLWAMGPLDNLVGMQYRMDHLENMKADIVDLTAYPVTKIKGYVEDFTWGPLEKIYIGDNDGDVDLLSPDVGALQLNNELQFLEMKMEEMAGSPKEAMGFRTPGEKTKYEVQRLENAASRIFQAKITQFERQIVEQVLNAMLELARRMMDVTTIRVFDDEFKVAAFRSLTREDITGNGRIRPIAARHFAEQAQMVQDVTAFFASVPGSDPSILAHYSSIGLARLFENLLNIEDYHIVEPYIRISEQGEAQKLANLQDEQNAVETQTAGGILPGDYDEDLVSGTPTVPQQ